MQTAFPSLKCSGPSYILLCWLPYRKVVFVGRATFILFVFFLQLNQQKRKKEREAVRALSCEDVTVDSLLTLAEVLKIGDRRE